MTDYAKFKDYVPNYLEINKSGLDTVKPTKEYLLIAKKLWYFDTVTPYYAKGNAEPRSGLPQDLEQYRIHSLSTEQVPYDDKDFVKTQFKSLVWNTLNECWNMDEKDYKRFVKN